MRLINFFSVLFTSLFIFYISATPRLGQAGERIFYDSLSSSNFNISTESSLRRGESVFVEGECDVEEILFLYGAKVVREERTGEVVSLYCHSPRLFGGIRLWGKMVNLHVAVASYGYTVGTPIIFGGY